MSWLKWACEKRLEFFFYGWSLNSFSTWRVSSRISRLGTSARGGKDCLFVRTRFKRIIIIFSSNRPWNWGIPPSPSAGIPIHNEHEFQVISMSRGRCLPRFETRQLGVLEERRAKASAAGTATASCKAWSTMRIHKNPLESLERWWCTIFILCSILFVQSM